MRLRLLPSGLLLFIHTLPSIRLSRTSRPPSIGSHPLANSPHEPHIAASFKVHRDSHSIHRQATSPPSSSSTNSSVSSSSNAAITSNTHRPPPAPRQKQPQPQQQQQPVIMYTHSPKVIRTNPRDFMSIVQKLTGLDSPGGPARGGAPPAARVGAGPVASAAAAAAAQDESSSSSSESCANAHAAGPPPPPYAADSQLMPPPARPLDAHFMAPDIPLFPDAPELQQLCAPRGLYGHQFPPVDGAALGPAMATNVRGGGAGNGGAAFSPSMVEAMRAFPDYN